MIWTAIKICVLYLASAKAGLLLATLNKVASPVWPATGIAIGALYLKGGRFAPAIWLGAFLANLGTDSPLIVIIMIALGNTFEALAGSYFLRKSQEKLRFLYQSDTLAIVLASSIPTTFSASVGVGTLLLAGIVPPRSAAEVWVTWWVGDMLGALFLLPIVVRLPTWTVGWGKFRPKCFLHIIFASSIFVLLTQCRTTALLFFVYPLLLIILDKFGERSTLVYTLWISAISVWATNQGYGAFTAGTVNQDLVTLQIFLGTVVITVLVLIGFRAVLGQRQPVMVLAIGWLISAIILNSLEQQVRARDASRFERLCAQIMTSLQSRSFEYEHSLHFAVGLFMASDDVSRQEWKYFVNAIDVDRWLPGIHGLGYIERISEFPGSRERFKKVPNVPPTQESGYHYVIKYIEPHDRNIPALNLDISTEANRLAAANRARDSGKVAATSQITLVQASHKGRGFLVYAPVYRKNSQTDSVFARRKNLQGWVYFPLHFENFLKHLHIESRDEVDYSIYESNSFSDDSLLYDSGNHQRGTAAFERVDSLKLGDRDFKVGFTRTEGFITNRNSLSAWVGAASSLLTLLLANMFVQMHALKIRAEEIASQQSRTLEIQRAKSMSSSKLATLGEMAGGLAHEVNNPLTIIRGKTKQVLARLSATEENAELRKDLSKIVDTADRIAKIINGLRAFARNAENDPMVEVPLSTIVNNTLDLCQERFKKHAIELRIDPIPDVTITCREVEISQVLLNLLSNAFDAVEGQPKPWVAIKFKSLPHTLRVEVRDNGRGVPKDNAEKIMQPFFTTKPVGRGTGLGLSISKGIIEQHRGQLMLDTTVAETCFAFELPKSNKSAAA